MTTPTPGPQSSSQHPQHAARPQPAQNNAGIPLAPMVSRGGLVSVAQSGATPAGASQPIDPREYIAEGTGLWLTLAWAGVAFSGLLVVLLGLATLGIGLILPILSLVVYFSRLAKARAALRGSALRVGPGQYPKMYAHALELSARLGLQEVPEIFVVDASQANATAVRLGGHSFVVLQGSLMELSESRTDILRWVLAHELAHHALGHTGMVRGLLSRNVASLSRRDEFTCDAVAQTLVGSNETSRDALLALMVGPRMLGHVSPAALDEQVSQVLADPNSRKAEKSLRMSHPLMLRRMARLRERIKI